MSLIVSGTTIPTSGDYIKVGSTLVDKVDVVKNGVRTTVWEKIKEQNVIGSPTNPASIEYSANSYVEGDHLESDHTWAGEGHPGPSDTQNITLWTGDITNYNKITISYNYFASGYGSCNAHLVYGSNELQIAHTTIPWGDPSFDGVKTVDVSGLTGTISIGLKIYAKTNSSYRPYSVTSKVTVKYLLLHQ